MGDNRAMEYMRGRRTLEVNPDHPVISSLKNRFDEHGDSDSNAQAMTELLYETSLLTSGFSVDSPKDFAKRCAAFCLLLSGVLESHRAHVVMSHGFACHAFKCSVLHWFILTMTFRLCMLNVLYE